MSEEIKFKECINYFAYGSNMYSARLEERVPSALRFAGYFTLEKYDLRFDKRSDDGSGKCNIYRTDNGSDKVFGALFQIHKDEKGKLDKAEGGYDPKPITVISSKNGNEIDAFVYIANKNKTDETLKPYSWYLNYVIRGAKETGLPKYYIEEKIKSVKPKPQRKG